MSNKSCIEYTRFAKETGFWRVSKSIAQYKQAYPAKLQKRWMYPTQISFFFRKMSFITLQRFTFTDSHFDFKNVFFKRFLKKHFLKHAFKRHLKKDILQKMFSIKVFCLTFLKKRFWKRIHRFCFAAVHKTQVLQLFHSLPGFDLARTFSLKKPKR